MCVYICWALLGQALSLIIFLKQLLSAPSKTGLKKRVGKGRYWKAFWDFPAPSRILEERAGQLKQLLSNVSEVSPSG